MKKIILLTILSIMRYTLWAQTGVLKGRVYDQLTNEGLPYATVMLEGTQLGTVTDSSGFYFIKNIPPESYNILASFLGHKKKVIYDITISGTTITQVDIGLEGSDEMNEVVVTNSPYNKTEESPVSLKTISASEIERNPGGNRDITRVIQSFPGVASAVSWRSDLIIRGGAPSENKFYLDGIEIPTINHFTTQGATGGVFGMINVNMLRTVDMYSGAFPANRGNTLSSLFEFYQKHGNRDKFHFTGIVGLSDYALMADGPVSKKTTYNLSARSSTQQFIGKLIGIPVIPTYSDIQFNIKSFIDEKNILTITGLGAYDESTLNPDFREGLFYRESNERDRLIIESFRNLLPINTQYNFTIGANYQRFTKNGFHQFVISNSHFNNIYVRYKDGDDSQESNKTFDYESTENEAKFRYEYHVGSANGFKLIAGVGYENVDYFNQTTNQRAIPSGVVFDNYQTELNMNKYAAFSSLSKEYFNKRATLSFGFRIDGIDYSESTNNPLEQFSPRLSLAYNFTNAFSFNFNTGRYYQLPPYTTMGYKNLDGILVNKDNGLKYISSDHIVAGLEYNFNNNLKITTEGYLKYYQDYPFLLNQGISLANQGSNFGVIGNEPVSSIGEGRSYGFEFMAQQKLWKGYYGILSYTWMVSEFKNLNMEYIPSAWDYRHIAVFTGGKKLKNNWEAGLKVRYASGGPYTPNNMDITSLKPVWDAFGQGVPDTTQLNTRRVGDFYQMDLRIDKKWYFSKWSLNIYIDIQNITNNPLLQPPFVYANRDNDNNLLTDPNDTNRYLLTETDFQQPVNIFPTLGFIVEF